MKTSELKPGDIVTINYGAMHGTEDATVTAVRDLDGNTVAEVEKGDDREFDSLWSDSTERGIGWTLKARATR
jgi:hypothetical protein